MILLITLALLPLLAFAMCLISRKVLLLEIVAVLFSTAVLILTVIVFAVNFATPPLVICLSELQSEIFSYAMLGIELLLSCYIIRTSIRNKAYLAAGFAIMQIISMITFEFTVGRGIHVERTLVLDKLSAIMLMIIGVIGSVICIYAVPYMRAYAHHHPEVKDRRQTFFALLFVFLSAMFGLVLANNVMWLFFCWEITTICSFLLIGYTKNKTAVKNSFRALTMNLGGGLAFAAAIIWIGAGYHVLDIESILKLENKGLIMVPLFLIAFAGMTKSAQMPFSSWLLGAMVAPTPTSALLHSSTMVKAGVYIILRFSPMFAGTMTGRVVVLIGAFTFISTALLAVSQSDGKKILAYSTVSNLGLIVVCAGVGTPDALWAAVMLIIFHAIAKSLLFMTVGSTEHTVGSRDLEFMDGLANISPALTLFMIIGIAGMFLAPFGMLISKWAAIKALIESGHILTVIIVAFGSAATLFFWAKWLGKLIMGSQRPKETGHKMGLLETLPLAVQAVSTVLVCLGFSFVSKYCVVPYLEEVFFTGASPIDPTSTMAIFIMMLLLFGAPALFFPLYRLRKRPRADIYMAGVNTGDNHSFYGSMGFVYQTETRNWYMTSIFDEKKVFNISVLLSAFSVIAGALIVAGGALL